MLIIDCYFVSDDVDLMTFFTLSMQCEGSGVN
jgi:hypothetical protein